MKKLAALFATLFFALGIAIVASSNAVALEFIYCEAPNGTVRGMSTTYASDCRSGLTTPGSWRISETRAKALFEQERRKALGIKQAPLADAGPSSNSANNKTHEITVVLGNDNRLAIAPKELSFVTGKLYRLVIKNPSSTTHYFWAPELGGDASWTDRVSVDKGRVGLRTVGTPGNQQSTWEIKILPGGTAVWSFVPEVAGLYKLGCSLPAHEAAGMTGEINVKPG